MKIISHILSFLKLYFLLCILISPVYALNKVDITDNGKKVTLTLPLKATITDNDIIKEVVTVVPLSSVYENIKWDKTTQKLSDHHFLLRVIKDDISKLRYEIINDSYTCAYNNPNRLEDLPGGISVVNEGYEYSISVQGKGNQILDRARTTTIDKNDAWLPLQGTAQKFIDLTLNITFPDISQQTDLMNKGGFCRGSVTMMVSVPLVSP
ncbi:TPA: hypothetical protein ACIBE3_004584 [Salmonella enterica subsp. enterica serovar Reading]